MRPWQREYSVRGRRAIQKTDISNRCLNWVQGNGDATNLACLAWTVEELNRRFSKLQNNTRGGYVL